MPLPLDRRDADTFSKTSNSEEVTMKYQDCYVWICSNVLQNAPAFPSLPLSFVLMIESRTWGYFHPTLGSFDVRANPSAPRIDPDADGARDAIVVISRAAAAEIYSGRLPFTQAEERGLVLVDASSSSKAPIRSALTKAYPVSHFSDFVCTEVA